MKNNKEKIFNTFPFLQDTTIILVITLLSISILGLFAARSPSMFTGELPLIGELIPLKLTATYIIVFFPIAALILSWLIKISSDKYQATQRNWSNETTYSLYFLFTITGIFSFVLSTQYFLILAPEELCSTRPHFDFLWISWERASPIFHCMKGALEINKTPPYYMEPAILQHWLHLAVTFLSTYFLTMGFLSWRKKLVA